MGMERMREIKQGEIYWADLGPIQGHEQAGPRPVIVIQTNPLNRSLSTIMIIPTTTSLNAKGLMITHFLDKEKTGLKRDSVALLYQIRTLDRRRLKKKLGEIPKNDYFEIRFKLIQNIWCAAQTSR